MILKMKKHAFIMERQVSMHKLIICFALCSLTTMY